MDRILRGNVSDDAESFIDLTDEELSGGELIRDMRKSIDDRVRAVVFITPFPSFLRNGRRFFSIFLALLS